MSKNRSGVYKFKLEKFVLHDIWNRINIYIHINNEKAAATTASTATALRNWPLSNDALQAKY